MKSREIQKKYIEFFRSKKHSLVPSASLIPENDPTVLFTTAGMHPLVPYIMGEPHPSGKRLVDVRQQKTKTDYAEFMKELSKEYPMAKKIILEQASYTGQPGVEEVLKRTANKILTETRVSREAKFVDEFLKRLNKGELVTYGKKEAQESIDLGAVEMLLVSVEKIDEFEPLMQKTEDMKGQVVLINSDHSAGEQFLKLGGIGCFLRFKIK